MARYFSPSTASFFDEDIHGQRKIDAPQSPGEQAAGKRPRKISNPDCRIPDDATLVSDETYGELMAAQSQGKRIAVRGGRPIIVDPVAPDPETQREQIRKMRNRLLAATDPMMLPDYPLTDEQRTELLAYRVALRDLTTTLDPEQPAVSVVWPEKPEFVA